MAAQKDDPSSGAYVTWLARLSPVAKAAMQTRGGAERPDDEKQDYGLWRAGLSGSARDWLSRQVVPAEDAVTEEDADAGAVRFGCVECENGEQPVVRLFKTAESLARHLGRLEGRDVTAVHFYGCFLRFSRGQPRYLLMPDNETVLVVPPGGEGPVHRVEAGLVEFDWQTDGFVGPPELADAGEVMQERLDQAAHKFDAPSRDSDLDPDDEDEEEDDEEEGEEAFG